MVYNETCGFYFSNSKLHQQKAEVNFILIKQIAIQSSATQISKSTTFVSFSDNLVTFSGKIGSFILICLFKTLTQFTKINYLFVLE
jgi:hypothetical protein